MLILVAGGINSLIALLCVRYAPRQGWAESYSIDADWPWGPPEALPSMMVEVHDAHSRYVVFDGNLHGSSGFGVDYFQITEHDIDRTVWSQTGAVTAGWPFRSFIGYSGALVRLDDSLAPTVIETWQRGLLVKHEEYWLPMLPCVWALIGNTMVTALVSGTLLVAPVAFRRRLRRRRGCCLRCGFHLTSDQLRCPECGTATQPAAT